MTRGEPLLAGGASHPIHQHGSTGQRPTRVLPDPINPDDSNYRLAQTGTGIDGHPTWSRQLYTGKDWVDHGGYCSLPDME